MKAEARGGQIFLNRDLQRVIRGVGPICHEEHLSIAADNGAGRIELRVGRVRGGRSRKRVRIIDHRKFDAGSADIRGVNGCAQELMFQTSGPSADVAVLEIADKTRCANRRDLVGWGYRRQALFKAIDIHEGIGGHLLGIPGGVDELTARRVDRREFLRRKGETKRNEFAGRSGQSGIEDIRSGAGEKVVLIKVHE